MATHGWTSEDAIQQYYPQSYVLHEATPPIRTYATPMSLPGANIAQENTDFTNFVHKSPLAAERRHNQIYYHSRAAIDESMAIWSGAGVYGASSNYAIQPEPLSGGGELYADWLCVEGDDSTKVQEGVTPLSAYAAMSPFGQALGGVGAYGSILPLPRPVVASEKILCASASRRFRQPKYECPHCPSKFTTKQNRTRHTNAHWGVKPFMCMACGKEFTTKSDMTRHRKKAHQGSDAGRSMDLVRV
ncbi:hypothetical protein EYR40_004661 [Pleurotus pulmonarius]|nr:hypothetical protein EYR38_001905 [Pleurotus pulmonarius]KAF4605870.1 hypothetical protein EYR40_004661 [Pleurotus pulmonarius]